MRAFFDRIDAIPDSVALLVLGVLFLGWCVYSNKEARNVRRPR